MPADNRKPAVSAAWVVGAVIVIGLIYWVAMPGGNRQASMPSDQTPTANVEPPAAPADEPGSTTGSTTPAQ